VYVIPGGPSLSGTFEVTGLAVPFFSEGREGASVVSSAAGGTSQDSRDASFHFGTEGGTGDVRGYLFSDATRDGIGDVLIGSYQDDHTGTDAIAACLYHGLARE